MKFLIGGNNMKRSYSEFNFDDDIELMNLTYQMNTGNFINYENNYKDEEIINAKKLNNPKIGL